MQGKPRFNYCYNAR